MKKTTLSLCILLLSIVFARAQTIGLSGPSTAGSDENITLTFTGETRAKYASSVMVDFGGSTYSTYFIVINAVTSFQSSAGGTPASKFNIKVYNTDSGNQTVTIKFKYGYNGTSGAGEGSITKTITITPPPPPVVVPPVTIPPGPTQNQNTISFSYVLGEDVNDIYGKHFSVSNIPLLQWSATIGTTPTNFYAEASPVANFATITASEHIATVTGFTNGIFPGQGFTQDTYIRMKTVYGGQSYYSNTLFVPANPILPPTVFVDPTTSQNQLILSPGSTVSSFNVTNPAILQYIQDNNLRPAQYKIGYSFSSGNFSDIIEVNRADISNLDFANANIPAFTEKLMLRMYIRVGGRGEVFSNTIEIPQ